MRFESENASCAQCKDGHSLAQEPLPLINVGWYQGAKECNPNSERLKLMVLDLQCSFAGSLKFHKRLSLDSEQG